jgi:hypothetical protein
MCGIKRINGDGFLDKIEFVAADDVGLGACALVSRGPVFGAVLFDFLEELVGPQVFQFYLDIFSVFIQIVDVSLHLYGGDGGFGAVDDQVDWDLEERVNKGETLLCGATFFVVFIEVVTGGD